ncbi:unnamed protein product [Rotaria socialis]
MNHHDVAILFLVLIPLPLVRRVWRLLFVRINHWVILPHGTYLTPNDCTLIPKKEETTTLFFRDNIQILFQSGQNQTFVIWSRK